MKLLKKVKIINWHYFQNVSFDLDEVNFLTGQNAAGKSTLIDAMQIVLLGDTTGRMFNKAANEKSGRTLKGYLKGEIGDNGEGSFKYLRNGRFTSYIALEWFDDVNNKSFTTGIVFDVYEDSKEEHRFFILKDKIPENEFILLDVPMSYKQLNDYFKANYDPKDYTFPDSNAQYQERIKEEFGNIKNKYFSLFKKAVSFTPITNIEQFLTEYVCDVPSEINIESMRSNIQQYKRLELEAENMQLKISKLESIRRNFESYVDKKKELDLASYVTKRITYQLSLDVISNLQKDIEIGRNHLIDIDNQINELEENKRRLTLEKENLIRQKVSSGSYSMTQELTTEKHNLEVRISNLENEITSIRNNFNSYINNYDACSKRVLGLIEHLEEEPQIRVLYKKQFEVLKDSCVEMINKAEVFKNSISNDNNVSKKSLEDFKIAADKFKEAIVEYLGFFKTDLANKVLSLNQSKQLLVDMQKGDKAYDYTLKEVRSELAHRLEDRFNEKVEVLIFADLIDIKNPKWVKAIEGYIYNQKFNFFVEDKYYKVANEILPGILRSKKYYHVGLVDASKLHEQFFSITPGSLAEEIETDHEGARDYANFLLGKMTKCENFMEARESMHGITPDAIGYRNFASFVIPERNYLYPVIGRKISAEALEARASELRQLEDRINSIRGLADSLGFASKLEVLNSNETNNASRILEEAEILPDLRAKVRNYEYELENAGSLEISTIDEKINKIDEQIKNIEEDKQQLILQKGSTRESIRNTENEKIPNAIDAANKIQEDINNSFDKEFINDYALIKFNEELDTGRSLISIRADYDDIFTKAQNRIRQIFQALKEVRTDYVYTYKLSYDVTKETNEEFDRDLVTTRDVKLPEYQAKIKEAYEKATKEFKDDFIFKLKSSIETVRGQIDELNEALKDAKFGQDSYQFTVSPNPQYREYYDMITDDLSLTYGQDEGIYFEKYQDAMANLFKLIGDISGSNKDKDAVIQQNVEKFTDYRTYLMFDMQVTKGEGKSYSLAKNMKKQSGGETQTPFYVSILASFSQLYRIKSNMNNSIRLVIFDEAFSKMDSTRIIQSIKILKQFGLQVILSAPTEKVSDLAKLVDKTLVVYRDKNKSYIDPFKITK